jgi:hypothetical protein
LSDVDLGVGEEVASWLDISWQVGIILNRLVMVHWSEYLRSRKSFWE